MDVVQSPADVKRHTQRLNRGLERTASIKKFVGDLADANHLRRLPKSTDEDFIKVCSCSKCTYARAVAVGVCVSFFSDCD